MKSKPMKYLDLKNDRSFRRFFLTCKAVLFSLIKSFLPIPDEAPDWSAAYTAGQPDPFDDLLELQEGSIPPNTPAGKQSELDIYVKLPSDVYVNIEMQNYAEEDFGDRLFTYWMESAPPLKRGQTPAQAKPSYSLAITNSDASSGAHHISTATVTWDNPEGERMTKRFMAVAAQLNKFNKSMDELVDMRDWWCYIMKHSAQLTAEQVEYLSQNAETKMILEHLAEMSKDDAEYLRKTIQQKREWEDLSRKNELEERARAQGMQEGMQEGQRGIALSMLQKGYEVSEISEVTDLPVAEIEQLNGKTSD